ncbi:MAG: hypothetical protein V1835_04475, partial [Candidatus Micrarchaeota archaeon]
MPELAVYGLAQRRDPRIFLRFGFRWQLGFAFFPILEGRLYNTGSSEGVASDFFPHFKALEVGFEAQYAICLFQ